MVSVVADMVSEPLALFVKRIRQEKKMSLADVERNSRRTGPGISNGYVSQIENGLMTNPSIDALRGLAQGLGISEDLIFAIARGKSPEDPDVVHARLIGMYEDIPPQCQKDVMDLLEVLQRNHSISARRARRQPRRHDIAAAAGVNTQGRNDIPRHPAVTDTPPDVPLPETTPQVPDDDEEDEIWRNEHANGMNGTNGGDS